MITLLIGTKGAGKTKKLISAVEKALETSKGNVVVVEKGTKLTYDISHKARLIDTDAYDICGTDGLVGFLSGICAGNYDVTDILVDSTLKIIGNDLSKFEEFITEVQALKTKANINITLSVSMAEDQIPESLAKYIAK
ncbi:MAG: hypothetical protein R3Y35_04890 [Clostridia bacterium]